MNHRLALVALLTVSYPAVALADDAPPPVAAAPVANPPAAFVQLGGDAADLEQQVGPKEWRPLCATPCNATVFGAGVFRVSGDGIRTSQPFVLNQQDGRTMIWVDGASSAARAGSLAMMIVGGAAIGVGLFLVGIGAFAGNPPFVLGGLATAGIGLVSLVFGAVWLAVTGRTTLQQRPLGAIAF